ncbi:MAG TPA: N-acetylmuramoyl-L-alanine amidase [Terracidiphilus sp.]|nr:N-acetylmuramoyl-L-alanine amidase [Terracidiphilus sp.]
MLNRVPTARLGWVAASMGGPAHRRRPLTQCLAVLVAAAASILAVAQTPPAPSPRFVVLLDAAHGGGDLGGRLTDQAGQIQAEKALTLALSVRLRSLLTARGIAVVTTRESDAMVDNDRRAEIANRANAAACLSLHASQIGTGIHIYASSLTPVPANQMTPWKTAQAAWVTRSLALAGVLNSALTHAGMTVSLGRTGLPAVDSMACPAVAVEIAPEVSADHPEPTGVDDPGYQAQVAQALAAAIVEWRSNGSRGETSHLEVSQP